MPGAGAHRWQPDRDLPWPAGAVLLLVFVNFAVSFILMLTIDRWANKFVTGGHWYQFHMKGGTTYYLSPGLGWYMDNDIWLGFGGLALFFLITVLYGVR